MSELVESINELAASFEIFKKANDARLDGIEKKANRLQFVGYNAETGDLRDAKSDLAAFMRRGEIKSSAGMMVGADPAGGYTVQPTMSAAMTAIIRETSPIRQAGARVVTIESDAFEEVVDRDEASVSWADETTARPQSRTPDPGLMRIPVHQMSAEPRATQKLLEDASIDIASWLNGKVSDKFSRTENAAFVGGNGVNQQRGLLTYPVYEAEDMPVPAAGSLSIAFVNLFRVYTIVDRVGIQVRRDPYTARLNVVSATRRRLGGDAANFEAVKLIEFAAS